MLGGLYDHGIADKLVFGVVRGRASCLALNEVIFCILPFAKW